MLGIVKGVFWVGSGTVFNLLVWVVSGKVMALGLGPAGVGMYGLLRQLAQNLNVAATFNGSTTLVQGLSSRPAALRPIYARNVLLFFLVLGLVVSLLLWFCAPWLGPKLLGEVVASTQLRWMLVPVVGMSLSAFSLGMLNGHRDLKALVICQALGPITALALIYPVITAARNGGIAPYAAILGIPYAVVGIAAVSVALRNRWLTGFAGWATLSSFRSDARHFFGLSSALLIAGISSTGLPLFLNYLVWKRFGLVESGQFWVAWSLSMTYVTVLLGSFGAYYLPTLSGSRSIDEKNTLILRFTRLVVLAVPILISVVVVAKGEIVRVMFSADLLPSLKVFRWMLLGDFFKILSWVWAFPMLAFAESKTFLITEIAINGAFALLAWEGFKLLPSAEFVGQLFLVIYIAYSTLTLIYVSKVHSFRLPLALVWGMARGLGVVLLASVLFWSINDWSWGRALLIIAVAMLNLWFSLVPSERQHLFAHGAGLLRLGGSGRSSHVS